MTDMIFDKIENAKRYLGKNPNLDTALTYIASTDLGSLPEGKTVIDGDRVFANVMQADTNPDTERVYEFHEKYYDIQIDLEGSEEVRFGTEYREVTQQYDPAKDIGFGHCVCEAGCRLSPGRFVICEPQEPHQPGGAVGGKSAHIRKIVVKVAQAAD